MLSSNSNQTLGRHAISAILAGTAAAACAAAEPPADAAPAVVPYRPTVTTPATLTAPGWVELEAGVARDQGSAGARRDSLPTTLKLAFTPDWGIRLSGDVGVRQTEESGQRSSGAGDASIVLKRRFALDDTHAFGLELGATVPTGRHAIGGSSGKTDYSVNAIYSADIGALHTDINLVATRLGATDPGTSRWQGLWAASLSGPINDQWGLVGELYGTEQRGTEGSTRLLLAVSYGVSKALVLDAGATRSLRSGVPDWSLFTGFTVLCAKLF